MVSPVLETLAERYAQLYLDPDAEGAREACREAVTRGIIPEKQDLSHFRGDERDSLICMDTPAGPAEILTLYDRKDFETFLRIMADHCKGGVIPETQGAASLIGMYNWPKIRAHMDAYQKKQFLPGDPAPDPDEEFRRFTSVDENYKDTLIVLSVGPYSGVPAGDMGLSEEEWIEASGILRTYHECTHVICRKLYREQIDAVWDELTADAIGIHAAFGRYDKAAEERFLGIRNGRYTGGRLENYIKTTDEKARNDLAERITAVLTAFEELFMDNEDEDPFAMIPVLEKEQFRLWGKGSDGSSGSM